MTFNFPIAGVQFTTCQPFNITWSYDGPFTLLSLMVTNNNVQQLPAPTPTRPVPQLTNSGTNVARAIPGGATTPFLIQNVPLATNVPPYSASFLWSSVNVPQGWYVVNATIDSYSAQSFPFFVLNGTDLSCLFSSTSTTSMSVSTTSMQSPSSSANSSSTVTPPVTVGGSSTSSTHFVGAIVGITIGAVALLSLALGAWFWLYRKRRISATKVGPSHNSRRWNGLSSVDSRGGLMGATSRPPRASSIGTLPMSPSNDAVATEKASIKHGEPSPFADGARGAVALAALPVLDHDAAAKHTQAGLARSYSSASSVSNGAATYDAPGRRPSVADSLDSMGYPPASPATGVYLPAPPLSRSHSVGTSTNYHTDFVGSPSTSSHAGLMTPDSVPGSPLDTGSPASASDTAAVHAKRNRRSLGGAKRKPVPAYNTEAEYGARLGLASTGSSSAPSPVPPPSPVPDHAPHYVTRSQAGHDVSQHDLVDKNSFGPGGIEGKQLHYLMPDPPMAPRD